MSDPARVFTTADGKRSQILGAGRLNVHAGPDFLDMAVLLNDVPGCYFFLGAKNEQHQLGVYAHHHPRFDFDEAVLPLGVAIMCEATTRYLNAAKN